MPSSQSNSYSITEQSLPAALELGPVILSSLDSVLCNLPLTKPTLVFVLSESDTRGGGGCFFPLIEKKRKGSFSPFSLTLHSKKEFFFYQQLFSTRRFDPETRTRPFFGYMSKLSEQTYFYYYLTFPFYVHVVMCRK